MHVEAWLARAAATAPRVTAIEAPDGRQAYAELLSAAQAGAEQLRARGAGPRQRVAIVLPAGLAFAQALHACMLLGAVAVPIDLRLTAAERRRMAAGAAVIVEEPLEQTAVIAVTAVTGATGVTGVTGGPGEHRHDLEAPAVVIHTSGTTSTPKPIELTYGNLLWSALGSAVALGLDPDERWLCALPLSHVGGLSILVRCAIYGTTAVVHERFDAERVLEALRGQDVTLVSLVATTLARLLDAGLGEPPRLRCALTGGGPLPPALVRRAREAGVPVCETYGLTECCSQAATAPPGVQGAGVQGAGAQGAGAPLFCTTVQIAPDGEILLRGPTVARGSLQADGRLHTGDLGRLDEHGLLHVTGRKADTIVTGGENVSPTEVEAVLEAHPAVVEAAVLGRADPEWGEAVHAIVVVGPGVRMPGTPLPRAPQDPLAGAPQAAKTTLDERQLREHCAARLAPYKIPKRFTLVSQPLPRTRSGKLLRRELG